MHVKHLTIPGMIHVSVCGTLLNAPPLHQNQPAVHNLMLKVPSIICQTTVSLDTTTPRKSFALHAIDFPDDDTNAREHSVTVTQDCF